MIHILEKLHRGQHNLPASMVDELEIYIDIAMAAITWRLTLSRSDRDILDEEIKKLGAIRDKQK